MGGRGLWLVLVAGYSNLKYSVVNRTPQGWNRGAKGEIANVEKLDYQPTPPPHPEGKAISVTPKGEQRFRHRARCPTCLPSAQVGLWSPLCSVGWPTQPNEADVAKWTAVSPADGNWSVWPTWQFFRSSLLKVTQNKTLSGCKSLLVAARHMLYQPAATGATSVLPGLQQTAGPAALNTIVMFKLDSGNEHIRTICYFSNVLVTKSHISTKQERTFPMLPFSHGSRISLNRQFFAKLCNSEHSTLNSHLSRHCKHSVSTRVLLYTKLCSNPACELKNKIK